MRFLAMMLAVAVLAGGLAATGGRGAAAASFIDLSTGVAVIMAAESRAPEVRRLRQVPSVGVVRLDTRPVRHLFHDDGLPDPREYRVAASRHAAGIRKLRTALAANPVTRRALERRGIPLDRVVGVRIASDGSLRLYLL